LHVVVEVSRKYQKGQTKLVANSRIKFVAAAINSTSCHITTRPMQPANPVDKVPCHMHPINGIGFSLIARILDLLFNQFAKAITKTFPL